MFNTNDYLEQSVVSSGNCTDTIRQLVKLVVDNKDAFEKELNTLKAINQKSPNNIFPIKIENIVTGYNCFEKLHEWYNIKINNNGKKS